MDLFNFDNEIYDKYAYEFHDESLEADEDLYLNECLSDVSKPGSKILKEQDAALNQPVMLEYLDALYLTPYHNPIKTAKLSAVRGWEIIKMNRYNKGPLPRPKDEVHQKTFEQAIISTSQVALFYRNLGSQCLSYMLRKTDPSSDLMNIFDIFNKKLGQKTSSSYWTKVKSLCTCPNFLQISGGLEFWTIVVNILNSDLSDQLINYLEAKKSWCGSFSFRRFDGHIILSIKGENNFIIVGHGWCYLPQSELLLDQSMSLMIKDIFLARRNSILYLATCEEIKEVDCVSKLLTIYSELDHVIKNNGNKAYGLIKMLEPLCNARMIDLAHSGGEIDLPNSFKEYLEDELFNMEYDQNLMMNATREIITNSCDPEFIVNIFGCFRHWGHPFIDWPEGLKKLKEQTTMDKHIDDKYISRLASRLAKKIISAYYHKHREWPMQGIIWTEKLPFAQHIKHNTWPSEKEMSSFGNNWHKVPLGKVYEMPETIPLADLMDDKSHSLTRSELKERLRMGDIGDLKSRRVILTMLNQSNLNVRDFLTNIDVNGLPKDDLIIGLKEKERELKIIGRFFSLMSIKLRTYFVLTEMMIAQHIIPLFDSLTMTDNLNKVFKKMIDRVPGHGPGFPEKITFANHLDYEKWNNHQRDGSTRKVFEVIDKAFGFNKLVSRTHEFFQDSLIYHANSPHLFYINEDLDGVNLREELEVCWNGQEGGLEGLRQKGWSIISLLMIEEESETAINTDVRVLAQGDNQVICLSYTPVCRLNDPSWNEVQQSMVKNLDIFLQRIRNGASKLGLIIKQEETWTSYNYMIYGKVALFRRQLINSGTKKWSRNGCLSNDQLPTLKNIMSSSVTTALTSVQHSESFCQSAWLHLFLAWETVTELLLFTPLIETSPIWELESIIKKKITSRELDKLKILLIFLDPSLGGIGGTNMCRFIIRQFPDGVSEGLTFWKYIYAESDRPSVKEFCLIAGNPKLAYPSSRKYKQLIDSPDSLNLNRVAEASNLIKMKISDKLHEGHLSIKNELVNEVLELGQRFGEEFVEYLSCTRPLFPRFISEVYDSSIFGYKESIVGTFQSSRTIRVLFKNEFDQMLKTLVFKAEILNIKRLIFQQPKSDIWNCSSEYADLLRERSWQTKIVGSTVPHPLEYIGEIGLSNENGIHCRIDKRRLKEDLPGSGWPYLGSATSSESAVHRSYERKTNYSTLKKPLALQSCINWFVEHGSPIWEVLCSNLQSFTDYPAETVYVPTPKRTGSALHRFACSRYSNGGYCATSHNIPSYLFFSTDSLPEVYRIENHDFMFQATLLYCQFRCCEVIKNGVDLPESFIFQFKETCCMRKIEDIYVSGPNNLPYIPKFSDLSYTFISKERAPIHQKEMLFSEVPSTVVSDPSILSYGCGITQSVILGLQYMRILSGDGGANLFPVTLYSKLIPDSYFEGLLVGHAVITMVDSLRHEDNIAMFNRQFRIKGHMIRSLRTLCSRMHFKDLGNNRAIIDYLAKRTGITNASYPLQGTEFQELLQCILISRYQKMDFLSLLSILKNRSLPLFTEMQDPVILGCFAVGSDVFNQLVIENTNTVEKIRASRRNLIDYLNLKKESSIAISSISNFNFIITDQELRHACQNLPEYKESLTAKIKYSAEYEGKVNLIRLELAFSSSLIENVNQPKRRFFSPLMSGLRLCQWMTGSHYKLKCMLSLIPKSLNHFWVIGDGSGGCSSAILRMRSASQLCFNSLLEVSALNTEGGRPAGPTSILSLSKECQSRCLNLDHVWRDPSDLTLIETWVALQHYLIPDIIVNEGQFGSFQVEQNVAICLRQTLSKGLGVRMVIWKTYYSWLNNVNNLLIDTLGRKFKNLVLCQTEFTSCCSEEIYLIAYEIRESTNNLGEFSCISPYSMITVHSKILRNRSIEDEIQRCLKISLDSALRGFPMSRVTNSVMSCLSKILSILNVPLNYHSYFSTTIVRPGLVKKDILVLAFLLLEISIQSVSYPSVVSTPRTSLQKISLNLSAILSFGLLTGYLMKDIGTLTEIHDIINNKVWVHYSSRLSKKEEYFPFFTYTRLFSESSKLQLLPERLNLALMADYMRSFITILNMNPSSKSLDDSRSHVDVTLSILDDNPTLRSSMFFDHQVNLETLGENISNIYDSFKASTVKGVLMWVRLRESKGKDNSIA